MWEALGAGKGEELAVASGGWDDSVVDLCGGLIDYGDVDQFALDCVEGMVAEIWVVAGETIISSGKIARLFVAAVYGSWRVFAIVDYLIGVDHLERFGHVWDGHWITLVEV